MTVGELIRRLLKAKNFDAIVEISIPYDKRWYEIIDTDVESQDETHILIYAGEYTTD